MYKYTQVGDLSLFKLLSVKTESVTDASRILAAETYSTSPEYSTTMIFLTIEIIFDYARHSRVAKGIK